jgi:hypothetical protein
MSEQGVLGSLLAAAVAAHTVLIAVVFVAGAALAIWAVLRRKFRWGIVGVAIAALPILAFAVNRGGADERYAERLAEVRALPRTPLTADHPRQLLVEGDLAPVAAMSLIVLGHFDAVETRSMISTAQRFALIERTPECATAARQWLDRDDRRLAVDRTALGAALAPCVATEEGVPWLPASADAVVVRTGTTVKNRTEGRIWGGGAVEIVVRRDQRESLVDYRELPYEERQATITSPLREALPSPPALDEAAVLLEALAAAERAAGSKS